MLLRYSITDQRQAIRLLPLTSPLVNDAAIKYHRNTAKMAAMFSQNPLMNGPNYSFSDVPKTAHGEPRQHRFNP